MDLGEGTKIVQVHAYVFENPNFPRRIQNTRALVPTMAIAKRTFDIEADTSSLRGGERAAMEKLMRVGEIFRRLYEESRHAQATEITEHLASYSPTNDEERAQLECIPKMGNGQYFSAANAGELKKAIAQVKEVAQAAPQPPKPKKKGPKEVFRDDFDGEDLADHWEVLKPNPDAFIVEDGKLLIVSGTPGSMANETVENVFRLSAPLPKGDWTITARFSVEFQTWMERAFIGIFDNRDNYLEISLRSIVGEYGLNRYPAFDIVGVRRSKGKDKTAARRIWRGKNTGDYSNAGNFADGTKTFPQPVLLRLQKKGRSYIGGVMLEGAKEPKWLNLDKFTILRQKGKVAVGLYKASKVEGEGTIFVDWVKIEAPEK